MLHLKLPRLCSPGRFPLHHAYQAFPSRVIILQSPKFLSTARITQKSTLSLVKQRGQCFHYAFRIQPQLRHYRSRPSNRPTTTSFPQFTPRPLKPLYQNRVFWGGIGFLGLLIWSPIPGWILFGGICYGFYRLFRTLKRAQDVIFDPTAGLGGLSSSSNSFLDALFTQDPRTREIAAKVQEMSIDRVERAIETDEGGIRGIFPPIGASESGEFHFNFPSEVSMVNSTSQETVRGVLDQDVTELTFEVRIRFMVYLASREGRKGAEIVARADVVDEGVKLKSVEVRGGKGRRVLLQGIGEIDENGQERVDVSGVGKGEGEGKIIDATKWTSR